MVSMTGPSNTIHIEGPLSSMSPPYHLLAEMADGPTQNVVRRRSKRRVPRDRDAAEQQRPFATGQSAGTMARPDCPLYKYRRAPTAVLAYS